MATVRFTRISNLSQSKLQQKYNNNLRMQCGTQRFSSYESVPPGYWKEKSNQRKFFDDLATKIGINSFDDWYEKLSTSLMLSNSGSAILKLHKNSAVAALMSAYPEYNWIQWKFHSPQGYWKSLENQRKYFDWLGKELGIQNLDEWYQKLTQEVIRKNSGGGILSMYKSSPMAAIMAVYPEHKWIPWKFGTVSRGYWKNITNQRQFFDDYGQQLGVQTLDDWYEKLNPTTIDHPGLYKLLKNYNGSVINALKTVYPEHNWMEWKFCKVSQGFWNSKDNIGAFLAEISEKLSIQSLDDWYRVDWVQMHQIGAGSLLTKYKGLYNILKQQYPHYPWDANRFKQVGKKTQRWLAVTLKKMFPNEEIQEDYMHPKALLSSSHRPLQLDVFIPSKSFAFEYQGIQHYEDTGMFSPSKTYQKRDKEKRTLCAANNIKLIEVPYWWNRTQEQLEEIISSQLSQKSQHMA